MIMMWSRASHKLTLPGASTATLAAAERSAAVLCSVQLSLKQPSTAVVGECVQMVLLEPGLPQRDCIGADHRRAGPGRRQDTNGDFIALQIVGCQRYGGFGPSKRHRSPRGARVITGFDCVALAGRRPRCLPPQLQFPAWRLA